MEEGIRHKTEKGTPQEGLISPVLANVFLHYVLDSWFEKNVKPFLKGEAHLVRFADDFIMMFQYENEARAVYGRLISRLPHFGYESDSEQGSRSDPYSVS